MNYARVLMNEWEKSNSESASDDGDGCRKGHGGSYGEIK